MFLNDLNLILSDYDLIVINYICSLFIMVLLFNIEQVIVKLVMSSKIIFNLWCLI